MNEPGWLVDLIDATLAWAAEAGSPCTPLFYQGVGMRSGAEHELAYYS
jgi:hypothetical protein